MLMHTRGPQGRGAGTTRDRVERLFPGCSVRAEKGDGSRASAIAQAAGDGGLDYSGQGRWLLELL